MKNLKEHVILYDAVCPMCNLYTKGFIKAGMLDENGRLPYQDMPDSLACAVDKKRFVNEIALVYTPSGKVYYGVESLLKIIGHSYPVVAVLFRKRICFKIADTLYKFISFNRRVMIPAKKDKINRGSMDPSFHRGYRVAYLLFTVFFTAIILSGYSLRLRDILPASSVYREVLVCSGQVAWQAVAITFIDKKKRWDYLGNLMTISFAGGLVLFVGLGIGRLFSIQNHFIYAGFFGAVVFGMFLEHIRRTAVLELDWRLTGSWVLYRLVILLIILNPFYAE